MINSSPPNVSIPVETPLTVTLEAGAWGVVLEMLGNGPFNRVAPLMQMINDQLRRSAEGHAATQIDGATAINGADHPI